MNEHEIENDIDESVSDSMKKIGLTLLIILVFSFCSCTAEETIKIVEYGKPFCREDFNIYNSDGSIYKDPDSEDNGYVLGNNYIDEYWQTARGLNSKSTIDDMLEAYKGIKADEIQFAYDFEDTKKHVLPDVIKNKSIRKDRKVNVTFEYDGYTMDLEYERDTLTSMRINTPQHNAEQQAIIDAKIEAQAKQQVRKPKSESKTYDNKSSTTTKKEYLARKDMNLYLNGEIFFNIEKAIKRANTGVPSIFDKYDKSIISNDIYNTLFTYDGMIDAFNDYLFAYDLSWNKEVSTYRGLKYNSSIEEMINLYDGVTIYKIEIPDVCTYIYEDINVLMNHESDFNAPVIRIYFLLNEHIFTLYFGDNKLKIITMNLLESSSILEIPTHELSTFEKYLYVNLVGLTAREVQYNMANNVDKYFVLEGVAELSDYYNYGFRNWEKDHFCLEVYPDDTYANRWYIYCDRDSFEKLFSEILNEEYIYVQMVCRIPSHSYQKNQNNMAVLEFIAY